MHLTLMKKSIKLYRVSQFFKHNIEAYKIKY